MSAGGSRIGRIIPPPTALQRRYVAFPPTATYQAPTLRPLSPQSQGSGPHMSNRACGFVIGADAKRAPANIPSGLFIDIAQYLLAPVVVFEPVVVFVDDACERVDKSSRSLRLMPTVDVE